MHGLCGRDSSLHDPWFTCTTLSACFNELDRGGSKSIRHPHPHIHVRGGYDFMLPWYSLQLSCWIFIWYLVGNCCYNHWLWCGGYFGFPTWKNFRQGVGSRTYPFKFSFHIIILHMLFHHTTQYSQHLRAPLVLHIQNITWHLSEVSRNKKFSLVSLAVEKNAWLIIFLVRLSPVLPFGLCNYLFGITKVKFSSYWSATTCGKCFSLSFH